MVEAAAYMFDTVLPAVRLVRSFLEAPVGLPMVPGLQESVANKAVGSW